MNKIFLVQLLLFATIIFTVTSCATITSGRSYVMSISSDLPNAEVVINHSSRYQLPARAAIIRSRENLDFKVLQDDIVVTDTILQARLSTAFALGNLIYPPIGHLIDLTNNNRFTYGRFIHIDSQGNIQRPNRSFSNQYSENHFRRNKQGNFNILFALPHFNVFHLKPQNEPSRDLGGFLGFGIGAEYFYRNNRSLLLRSDVVMADIPFILLWLRSLIGVGEFGTAFNVNLTDNLHFERFRFGYGLNFASNTWRFRGYYDRWESMVLPDKRKTNNMLGLALSAHYRFRNHFHIGVIYRPSFLELSRRRLMYEHTISLDFKWKIRL